MPESFIVLAWAVLILSVLAVVSILVIAALADRQALRQSAREQEWEEWRHPR